MKQLPDKTRVKAFTLIELLVVVAIIVVLWVMIMPTTDHTRMRDPENACRNNQKQITLGFMVWASDNDSKLPWQVSTNDGGTMELIPADQAASQFQPLLNITKYSGVFFCPSDKVKSMALDNQSLSGSNLSYFVNVDATMTNGGNMILTGDRHLQVADSPVKPGLFIYTNGMMMSWTLELHPTIAAGIMSFIDGHVEKVQTAGEALTKAFKRQSVASERLLVP